MRRLELTRRRFLAAAGAGVTLLAADALLVEPRDLTVTRHRIRSPGAPAGSRPVRIVQLTDLHLRSVGPFHEKVARAVAAVNPHLVVFSGDSVDHPSGLRHLGDFLSLLDPATPKVATWGNWEHYTGLLRRIAEVYARHGCRVLDNESASLYLNGAPLLVTGLDSAQDGSPDLARALQGVEPSPNHLVVAHCPIQRDQVEAGVRGQGSARVLDAVPDPSPLTPVFSPSLVIAGHTHGGQVTVAGWAPVTPVGSGRYVAGWYRDATIPLYVSRGIGMTALPVRFWCPPEVAVFEWELTPAAAGVAPS